MNNIDELRKSPHLSASSIYEYMDCSLAYKFSRIDKIQPEYSSDSMEFGIAIHRALGDYYYSKQLGKIIDLDNLLIQFERYWNEIVNTKKDLRFKNGKDKDKLLDEGKELLKTYITNLPDNRYKVLGIEEPVVFHIPQIPIPIIGYIDLIEEDELGTIVITDFKTSSKSYSNDEIDNNTQLTIYHLAIKEDERFKEREVLLKLDILVKTKTPKFEQHYITRTLEDEKRMKKKIALIWDAITKGVFIPNDSGWRCKNCFYKEHCDQWIIGGV